jgi:endopeptidase La
MDLTISEYKIYNLQQEYQDYTKLISGYQVHIDHCYDNKILDLSDRNCYLNALNDLLRNLGWMYNATLCDIGIEKEEGKSEMTCHEIGDIFPLIGKKTDGTIKSIQELVNIWKSLKVSFTNKKDQIIFDQIFGSPFPKMKTEMINLGKKIGFPSVTSAFKILFGNNFTSFMDKATMEIIIFFDKVFVPLTYETFDDKRCDFFDLQKIDQIHTVLFDNSAKLMLPFPNSVGTLVLTGYCVRDFLNINLKTSAVCYPPFYQRKKIIEGKITKLKSAKEDFKKTYLKNSNLLDVIGQTEKEYVNNFERDYNYYKRITSYSFMTLMKEFLEKTKELSDMYRIIKLLLLGPENIAKLGGLLFGLTKDKKIESNLVSELIYKNLGFSLQIKLRKATTSLTEELEKIKALTPDCIDMKTQVLACVHMPEIAKSVALDKIEEMTNPSNDYFKQLQYVRILLNYPWPSGGEDVFFENLRGKFKESQNFLNTIMMKMNNTVYGHIECKDAVQQLIAKWISNPECTGSAIGLVGPPGVGKTLIAKSIGDILGIPFVQIALGGHNDGEILHGHGYTYSGAQPGMVVKKMVEAGSSRCIMYFDELDKACGKHGGKNEIFNILINMTDPNMNMEFQDRFFQEITFPLTKVIFIFSYNDASAVDSVLLDRLAQIKVEPFSSYDKVHVARNFLLNEIEKTVGFPKGMICISDEDLSYIVEQYTFEAGVRDLKRKLETLFMKLNVDRIHQRGVFKESEDLEKHDKINISRDMIIKYINQPVATIQQIHKENTLGVINGLYATSIGSGGIVPIQIYRNFTGTDKRFSLKLTGYQGQVMRESIRSAFTAAAHLIKDDIRNEYIKKNPFGFHIHTPSGAVPKDGPSAGGAFATAFVSQFLKKKIRHDIAITGEIELTGKITEIGGLSFKLIGAKRAGVKLVMVSKDNEKDLRKIKDDHSDLFDDKFQVLLVNDLHDVLRVALIGFDADEIRK